MLSHQRDNCHVFLEKDSDKELTSVQIDLPLFLTRITSCDQSIDMSFDPLPFFLISPSRLTKEELNNTYPQRASALLIQALDNYSNI